MADQDKTVDNLNNLKTIVAYDMFGAKKSALLNSVTETIDNDIVKVKNNEQLDKTFYEGLSKYVGTLGKCSIQVVKTDITLSDRWSNTLTAIDAVQKFKKLNKGQTAF